MPNLLVYVEIRDGRPTDPSLFAVAEARRVARAAGATVFAMVASESMQSDGDGMAVTFANIAAAGADKILRCESPALGGPIEYANHGRAVVLAAQTIPPLLILLPAGTAGAALGPAVAARLGAAYAPFADLHVSENPPGPRARITSRAHIVRLLPDGRSLRRLDPAELERPIVATLGAGRPPSSVLRENTGFTVTPSAPARVTTLHLPPAEGSRVADGSTPPTDPDPDEALELATLIVLISDQALVDPQQLTAAIAQTGARGIAVAVASDASSSVLARACPEVLVKIGVVTATVRRSPRTRVVLALPRGTTAPEGVLEDVDILWHAQSDEQLRPPFLASLLADIVRDGELGSCETTNGPTGGPRNKSRNESGPPSA